MICRFLATFDPCIACQSLHGSHSRWAQAPVTLLFRAFCSSNRRTFWSLQVGLSLFEVLLHWPPEAWHFPVNPVPKIQSPEPGSGEVIQNASIAPWHSCRHKPLQSQVSVLVVGLLRLGHVEVTQNLSAMLDTEY